MAADNWRRIVAPHFDFLRSMGYMPAATTDFSPWGITTDYQRDNRIVRITYSGEFVRVEVELLVLEEAGEDPVMIWFDENEVVRRALLDNVVEARRPDLVPSLTALGGGLDRVAVERQLVAWAELLPKVAEDFLADSDRVFAEVHDLIGRRMAAHPQELTIWLPADAGPEDEAAAVAQARMTTPSNVKIVARRYDR